MNRNSYPILKPKAFKPRLAILAVKSEQCFTLETIQDPSTPHRMESDCDLDCYLERRIKCQIKANAELNERSLNLSNALAFRPPSARPINPFNCGLIS